MVGDPNHSSPLDTLEKCRGQLRPDEARMWYRWGLAIGRLISRLDPAGADRRAAGKLQDSAPPSALDADERPSGSDPA